MTSIRQQMLASEMPSSEDTKVLVHSTKKVLPRKIDSLHLLDQVHSTYLERTSSVRLHKAQYSVSVIQSLLLVVQTRRLSLQLLSVQFYLIFLEQVQKVEIYYQPQERLFLDLLVPYLVSNSLLVSVQELYYLKLVAELPMFKLQKQMEMSISSILLERCDRVFLYTLPLGYHQKEISQQKNTIGVLLLPLQLNLQTVSYTHLTLPTILRV